mgnify:CR=1 FL=1
MRNLAGDRECDTSIEYELRRAKIDIVHGERSSREVPASLTGKLGPFTFVRAWSYWMVAGFVPLAVAKELHADPVGCTDIRVDGHCGCPSPETKLELIARDGRKVINVSLRSEFERILPEQGLPKEFIYSDDPAAGGTQAGVTNYHIDSEVGLRLFADTIRKHGLDK